MIYEAILIGLFGSAIGAAFGLGMDYCVQEVGLNLVVLKKHWDDVAYDGRKIWIDAERFVPLKEDLFAKSGQLLKRTTLSDVKKIQGRWFPTVMVYKDMLKQGDGTEFRITSLKFDQEIEEYIFTKAALKQ